MGNRWHLDPLIVDGASARRRSGSVQVKAVRSLAQERLHGVPESVVLQSLDEVDAVRRLGNEVVHQDWMLRGPGAMRPVAELASVEPAELGSYLAEWKR